MSEVEESIRKKQGPTPKWGKKVVGVLFLLVAIAVVVLQTASWGELREHCDKIGLGLPWFLVMCAIMLLGASEIFFYAVRLIRGETRGELWFRGYIMACGPIMFRSAEGVMGIWMTHVVLPVASLMLFVGTSIAEKKGLFRYGQSRSPELLQNGGLHE